MKTRTMALGVAAVALAVTAQAGVLSELVSKGQAAGTSSSGRKTYDANTLSPGALKMCLLNAYQIDYATEDAGRDGAVLEKDREALSLEVAPLKGKPATDKAVVAYLEKEKAFNA